MVKCTYHAIGSWPEFATYWFEDKDIEGKPFLPELPEKLRADGRKLPTNGNLIFGTKGELMGSGDYWGSPQLLPYSRHEDFGLPAELLERSPGQHAEFFMACRGERSREFSKSNYSYSGPMTANIQLINLCARAGKKLELNEASQVSNDPAMNEFA